MAEQKMINAVVAMAYEGELVDVDIHEIADDIGVSEIDSFYPVSIEMLAERNSFEFSDEALVNNSYGFNNADEITDDMRIEYANGLLHDWIAEPDADIQGVLGGFWLEDSDGRSALVAYEIFGYSFSGVRYEMAGIFQSEDELRQYYRDEGYFLSDEELKDKSDLLNYWKGCRQ